MFCFIPRASGTHFLKERAISFSSGFSGPWDDSVRCPASSLSPTTHFCQQPREYGSGTMYLPMHLWPVRLGPTEFGEDASERTTSVPSTPTPFRCTTTRTSIVPLEGCLQRLAYWIVDTVALAYQSQGQPCPQGVRAHYTRSVASSHALAHGASLADHCRAAGWATLNTFKPKKKKKKKKKRLLVWLSTEVVALISLPALPFFSSLLASAVSSHLLKRLLLHGSPN